MGDRQPGVFERLYARLEDYYFSVLLFSAAASIPALTLLAASLSAPYFQLSFHEYLVTMAVVVPWMVLIAIGAEVAVAKVLQPLRNWLRADKPSTGASEAWEAAVVELPRAVLLGGAIVVVGAIPATTYVTVYANRNFVGILAAVAGITAFILAGAALHYLLWERALRPLVLETAARLPADFRVQRRSLGLSAKLLMLIPIMNVITGFFTGSLIGAHVAANLRPLLGLSVAIGVTAFVAVPLTLMLRRSLLRPLEELLRAMGRVERGDLATGLPVISADELGTIAEHFNSMLQGLRERESLREHNIELVEELRASRTRIVAASDAARRKVERDLHDGAQQRLVLLKMKLGLLEGEVQSDPKAAAMLEEVKDELGAALADLRDLAHGIYPAILEHEGLPGALGAAVERSPLAGSFNSDGAGRYRPEVEAAVYFCCLEALQNAAKHAGDGAEVTVHLRQQDGELHFEVADNGRGYDVFAVGPSTGLQNMADRLGALGGELKIESAPGEGTRVGGRIPVEETTS